MKILVCIIALFTSATVFGEVTVKEIGEGTLVEKTFNLSMQDCVSSLARIDKWEVSCNVVIDKKDVFGELLVKSTSSISTFPATEAGEVNIVIESTLSGYSLRVVSAKYPISDELASSLLKAFYDNQSTPLVSLSFIEKK